MRLTHRPSPLGSGRAGPSDSVDSTGHGFTSQDYVVKIEHKTHSKTAYVYINSPSHDGPRKTATIGPIVELPGDKEYPTPGRYVGAESRPRLGADGILDTIDTTRLGPVRRPGGGA
jgi:hypothetical protein